jgi:methanogen extracellular protein (TIGR04279 family)/PGF-pre-PGF domain-containing protein
MKYIIIIIITILAIAFLPIEVQASNLGVMQIESENLTFINHTSAIEGNWIELLEGESIRIPEMTFIYSGINNTTYTYEGKNITINSTLEQYQDFIIKYPFTTHKIYLNNSNVNFTFHNSSDFTQNVDIYLIKTNPTTLRDIADSIFKGNTNPLRELLNSSNKIPDKSPAELKNYSLGELTAGDYILLLMLNESNQNNLTFVTATAFEVLEYQLNVTAPDNISNLNTYDIEVQLNAPENQYTYGAALIHNDSYKCTLKLKSNGTKIGTNLTADGVSLVEAFKIADVGLKNINRNILQNKVGQFLGSSNGTISFKPLTASNSTNLSLNIDNLKLGKYILMVGVWSSAPDERLIGFNQKEVELGITRVVLNASIPANQSTAINASETYSLMNTIIEVNSTVSAGITLTLNYTHNASLLNANPAIPAYGLASNQISLDRYIQINLTGVNQTELNYVNLSMYYSIADLDRNGDGDITDLGDLNEQTLKIYWYDAGNQTWRELGPNDIYPDYTPYGGPKVLSGERNTTAKYIKVSLNHFSIFTLVGEQIPAPTPPPAEGGGAAGGGGPTVGEPPENIDVKEVQYILTIRANEHVIKQFTKNHSVMEIGFTYLAVADEVSITIEKLINRSLLVNLSPPGIVYEYINIWVYVPNPALITNASIKIKVDKNWTATNNIDPASIAMYRYKDETWNKLPTEKISEDNQYLIFLVATPGFSPFAITGEKLAPTPTPTPTITPTPTPTPTPTITPTPTPTLVTGIEEERMFFYLFIAAIIGGIIGFGAIIYLITRFEKI